MTLYARSDLAAVTVSPAHGGCGSTHSRPAPGGQPENLWQLSCAGGCEEHLRSDPHWSTTLSEIPETYDEKKSREDYEKRGAKDVNTMLALALARMTGGEIPATVAAMITGNKQHIPGVIAGTILCVDGHENPAGVKFCNECGAKLDMRDARALEPPPESPQDGNGDAGGPVTAGGRKPRLRDMRHADLIELARAQGLDTTGGRVELLDRIRAARQREAAA
jgi:hypothetical protein